MTTTTSTGYTNAAYRDLMARLAAESEAAANAVEAVEVVAMPDQPAPEVDEAPAVDAVANLLGLVRALAADMLLAATLGAMVGLALLPALVG